MTPEQQRWLIEVAERIPQLFEPIEQGNNGTQTVLGVRAINGKHVRLSLVAEVVDPGRNPLHSHASVNMPQQPTGPQLDIATSKPRNRKRAKRW